MHLRFEKCAAGYSAHLFMVSKVIFAHVITPLNKIGYGLELEEILRVIDLVPRLQESGISEDQIGEISPLPSV